jgi:hypothetical protein
MVLLCLFLLVSGARADEASRLDLFDACWNTVARRLFDRDARGRGLEAARDRFRPRAAAADSTEGVRAVLDEMLASLDVSHAAILDRRVHAMVVRELAGERVWTFGAVLEEAAPGRLFVRALYDGSPLDAAGVRFGDRIVAIDGVEARASGHLLSAGADARDRGHRPRLPGPTAQATGVGFGEATGRRIQKVLPSPSTESAPISPPITSTMRRAIARPRPKPSCLRDSARR